MDQIIRIGKTWIVCIEHQTQDKVYSDSIHYVHG